MLKRIQVGILLALLLIPMLVLGVNFQSAKAIPRTIIVPTHYPTISEALNFAMDGDTIYVLNGTYRESVFVDKSVRLIGENKNTTIIEGSVALVGNNAELKHFNITRVFQPNTGGYAVLLHSSNILIEDNIIQSNCIGIYFQTDPSPPPQNITLLGNDIIWYNVPWYVYVIFGIQSPGYDYSRATRNLKLIGNRIEGWPSSAIACYLSGKNEFINNTILNNTLGIGVGFGESGSLFRGNIINGTKSCFNIWSSGLEGYLQDIDNSNLINGKPFYYLVNQSNIIIDNQTCTNPGFLGIINSKNVTIQNFEISGDFLSAYATNMSVKDSKATAGVGFSQCSCIKILGCSLNPSIGRSKNVSIEKNDIDYSIDLHDSENCTIKENNIQNGRGLYVSNSSACIIRNHIANNTVGIELSPHSTNLTITENFISENDIGIRLEISDGNRIYLNNFVDNDLQLELVDSFTNIYDNGYEGNYWSDYNGTDTNRDGIGDTIIPHSKVDWLPLMGVIRPANLTYERELYEIYTISNSTIVDCKLNETLNTLYFNATGPYNTIGFCRTRLPKEIGLKFVNDTHKILTNGKEPSYVKNWTYGEYTYLYFEYEHPQDRVAPITMNDYDDAWHNADLTITLEAADNDSGVAETYYRINNGSPQKLSEHGQPIITTESRNNTLEYWSVDNAGNEELPHNLLTEVKLDKSPPSGSILINENAAYVNSTSVTLTLSANDATSDVIQIRFSNDNIAWAPWEPYSTSKTWALTSGDGAKAVYVQFMDNAGLISNAYEDSIVLDTAPPMIGVPFHTPENEIGPNQEVRISVNVTDFTSYVKSVRLSYASNTSILEFDFLLTFNSTTGLWEFTIPGQQANTLVQYKIIAYDNAGNCRVNDNNGQYYSYTVIPEFPSFLLLLLFMIATLLAVIVRRRH